MSNTSQSFSSWLLDLHPKSDAQAPKSPDDLGRGWGFDLRTLMTYSLWPGGCPERTAMSSTTGMSALREALKARREAQDRGKADLQKWLEDLQALADQIASWVEPLREANLLAVERSTMPVHEVDHGQYEAPWIRMSFPGSNRTVSVEARGLEIVGAVLGEGMSVSGMRGRADMVSASGDRIMLFRNDDRKWVFVGALPGRNGSQHPVDEDTFATALRWLLP
jgi:hypothetical protein